MTIKKINLAIWLAVLLLTTIVPLQAAQAYPMADSFQSPMASYVVNDAWRFGQNEGNGVYHAGEDLQAIALTTEVRAIANGKVVYVQKNSAAGGYGQAVVVEHTLPDNTKIISIYGHLSRQKFLIASGTDVTKNQLLGYIGETSENGGSAPHLHFGIKKGAYANAFEGRTTLSGLSNFYKPSDYLNLIRTVNTPEVYRLANFGNKIWVSSADTFNSCGWSWKDIRPVSIAERNNHPTSSGLPCFAAGTFIKRADNPEISQIRNYQETSSIQNRFRHPFGSWDAFIRAGGKSDLSNVKIVSYSEYYSTTQGKTRN